MQENYSETSNDMQDISSTSKEFRERSADPMSTYKRGLFKNIGTIIKAISFIVAFGIIAVSFILAFFLFTKDPLYMAIAAVIVIFGTFFALIVMFLIYGLGQLLCQNDELIKIMRNR